MKKMGKIIEQTTVYFRKIKKCKFCGRNVKGYRKIKRDDGKICFDIPVFNCDCQVKELEKKNEEKIKERISYLFQISNIDAEFLTNDFKVYRNALIQYYESFEWIRNGKQLLIYGDPGNHKNQKRSV